MPNSGILFKFEDNSHAHAQNTYRPSFETVVAVLARERLVVDLPANNGFCAERGTFDNDDDVFDTFG